MNGLLILNWYLEGRSSSKINRMQHQSRSYSVATLHSPHHASYSCHGMHIPATSTNLTAGVSTISPFKNRKIVASTLILRTLMFDDFFITIVLSLVNYMRGATIGQPVIFLFKSFQICWGQWEDSCVWNLWSIFGLWSFWGEWVIRDVLK